MTDANPPLSETAAPQGAAGPGQPRRYDLSSRERMVGQPIPTLDIVSERFARRIEGSLFGMLSRHIEVQPAGLQVQRHTVQMAAFKQANLSLITLAPLAGSGLVCFDGALFHGMIDVMYGGTGVGGPGMGAGDNAELGRDLSPTELRLLERLVRLTCNDYRQAWGGIHPLEPQFLRTERLPQFAAIAGPDEVVVVAAFDVRIGELTGQFHIAMPYASLEPLHDILYASPLSEGESVDDSKRRQLMHELASTEVTMVAELARASLTIEQLLTMQKGDFIELDRLPTVMASIEGVPLFECNYGIHHGKYALRIQQCLNPSGDSHDR